MIMRATRAPVSGTLRRMRSTTPLASALIVLLAIGTASTAFAGDGRLEINQACAVNTGCFPGDTAGFPVEITVSGSYLVTSDLSVTATNTIGVEITAGSVTLDLGGFTLAGPVTCSGLPVTCDAGTGHGIFAGSGVDRSTVMRGGVRGFGGGGIDLDESAHVSDVTTSLNGFNGLDVGSGGTVVGVVSDSNDGAGIRAGAGRSVIRASTARSNNGIGIDTNDGSVIVGNVVDRNAFDGIVVDKAGVVEGNTVTRNLDGIDANSGSLVVGNAVYDNTTEGIRADAGAQVIGNTIFNNLGAGLGGPAGPGGLTYRENTITDNVGGTITGTVIDMGANSCDGAPTCP